MESTLQFRRRLSSNARLAIPPATHVPVILAAVLGYLMLLPPQLNATINGSTIPPYRFFLLLLSLYIFSEAIKGRMRLVWTDFFVGSAVIWICLAMSITSPANEAVTASVAHIADIGLAYLFARIVFVDLRTFRMFLLLILPGILLVSIITMIESLTFTQIVQPAFSKLTGKPVEYVSSERMGLMRAQGPFAHPISAGIFLSSFLPLYWLAGFRGWVRACGAIASLASIFSVSSAAFISLFASIFLLIYNKITELIYNITWRLFFTISGIAIFVAELGTKSGTFSLVMRFASLNSDTGYRRVLIWKYGYANVAKNPWFGLGYGDWERPIWMTTSVDNYWLLIAMRFGVFPSAMFALATLLAVFSIMRKSASSLGVDRQCERGVAMALSVFAFGLISVAVWLTVQVWFFVLLGIAVSLSLTANRRSTSPLS